VQSTLGHGNIATTSVYLLRGLTGQAACTSILGCFFDEGEATRRDSLSIAS